MLIKREIKEENIFYYRRCCSCATIIAFAIKFGNKVEIPEPPYIDENGEVNWDKKFQHDKNK